METKPDAHSDPVGNEERKDIPNSRGLDEQSVNDLIALGIADEAGMSGNKFKIKKETSNLTETMTKIDSNPGPSRLPRGVRRSFRQVGAIARGSSKPGPSRLPREVRRNFRQGSSGSDGRGSQQSRNTPYGQRQNQCTSNQGQRPMPNNSIICYACQKTGHIARNCPNRRCWR